MLLPRRCLHLVLAGATCLGTTRGQETHELRPVTGWRADPRLRLQWENDSWLSSEDRFYTNGAFVGWTLADGAIAEGIAGALSFLPFRRPEITGQAVEITLAQQMFTPQDIETPTPLDGDRPYAGWLHLDVQHQTLAIDPSPRADDVSDTWFLQVGVVGPSSLAGDTQIQIHQATGAPRPRGWGNQLHDEPGLVLGYRRDFRAMHDSTWPFGIDSDFEGHYGANVGNVDTSGCIGGHARVGWNLPRHFGSTLRDPEVEPPHRIYLSAGISGRLVLRNIFLDGNTFRSSADVDRNHWVADFEVGLHWEPCRSTRIGVVSVARTPEFDAPDDGGDLANFVAATLEILF